MLQIQVIEDGQVSVLKSKRVEEFRKMNLNVKYPFGEMAKRVGPSPVTLRVFFMDGNQCTFRGDKMSPWVNIMLSNLGALLLSYMNKQVIKSAVIYDNRVDGWNRKILDYSEGQVKLNYIPVYLTNYEIKHHDKNKS